LFSTEKYDTVWQLTSTATARTRPGTDLVDVFAAMFPSASITGAPKAAAMAIIAAREVSPRGVYCGAIGFGGPDSSGPDAGGPDAGAPGSSARSRWVFNVGIRTVVIDRGQGMAWYGTGGGVTYDSTAADEYAEATLKAAVLSRSSNRYQLLETMRWDPGTGVRRWPEHLRRLNRSAEYFAIPLQLAHVQSAVALAIARARPRRHADTAAQKPEQGGSLRVRLVLDRDGTPQVTATPLTPMAAGELILALDTAPVDPADPFLHHKTTQRACYLAAAARHPDCDDVILVNPTGHVTETTIGNLVVMVNGRWVTPPTSSGCLPGAERAALLAEGVIAEAEVTVAQVASAPALARINSVRGWQAATLRRG
jgi:para-aminobenzoate synthetase/4-amino-4-deoxychorismate lyase